MKCLFLTLCRRTACFSDAIVSYHVELEMSLKIKCGLWGLMCGLFQ